MYISKKTQKIIDEYGFFLIKEIPIFNDDGRQISFSQRYERLPDFLEEEAKRKFLGLCY